MAKVWKREWSTPKGEKREAWVADWFSMSGNKRHRHIKTFARKKDAEEFLDTVKHDIRKGVHTIDRKATVADACALWLDKVEKIGKRERGTLKQYREHTELHINPRIGSRRLATLTAPDVVAFADQLQKELSRPMARKVMVSLKSVLRTAQTRGRVAQNVAHGIVIESGQRGKAHLEVGKDLPTTGEMELILRHARPNLRAHATIATLMLTGIRCSELRGLPWKDIDTTDNRVHVRRRADRFNAFGPPKSRKGQRSIKVPPSLIAILKQWRFARPKSEFDLVFPRDNGGVQSRDDVAAIYTRAQVAAGLTVPGVDKKGKPVLDKNGKPTLVAKYSGPHTLRHYHASLCANKKERGGLGLSLKETQERLGHATLAMTADTYGHLFDETEDDGALEAFAQRMLHAVG
jgi:integrase